MRLFIAYVLSSDNQTALGAAARALVAATGPLLHAVPPGTAHLTFGFMPRASADDVERIAEGLRRAASAAAPVEIGIAGSTILPGRDGPRLVYAPITIGGPPLEHLSSGVDRAVRACAPGLEISATASPHVTLARFRKQARPADGRLVEQALAGAARSSIVLRDVVSRLQLMRSSTLPAGPEYAELLALTLGR